jgi:TorA maturation chaperone TorD
METMSQQSINPTIQQSINPFIHYSNNPSISIFETAIMKNDTREVDLALCRSAMYEALALGFRPPTAETVKRLILDYHNRALAEIAAMMVETDSPSQREVELPRRIRQLNECFDARNLESLERSYFFLFGHTAQPKVPPYETEYGEEALFQQPQELADISGFVSVFGLKLNNPERIDHISCECEFLCFLNRKEAHALEANNAEMLEETRRAQRLFLKDHLGRFVPAFAKMLNRENPKGFYGALGNFCYDFIRMECARINVSLGSELLRLRPTDLMDGCFTCGSGEELIQITRSSNVALDECES